MVLTRDAVSLDGRVAVVTGGGSGIGRGIATAFAEFGAKVAIWEKDAATAQSSAEEAGGLACACDVRDTECPGDRFPFTWLQTELTAFSHERAARAPGRPTENAKERRSENAKGMG